MSGVYQKIDKPFGVFHFIVYLCGRLLKIFTLIINNIMNEKKSPTAIGWGFLFVVSYRMLSANSL